MIKPHHVSRADDGGSRPRHRHAGHRERRRHVIPLTPDGVPAAVPDAPRPSPVVSVSDESRARYPWLPARVIAGSVWRGTEYVRVDAQGVASPWRRAPTSVRG
jgi:hypothetical protein